MAWTANRSTCSRRNNANGWLRVVFVAILTCYSMAGVHAQLTSDVRTRPVQSLRQDKADGANVVEFEVKRHLEAEQYRQASYETALCMDEAALAKLMAGERLRDKIVEFQLAICSATLKLRFEMLNRAGRASVSDKQVDALLRSMANRSLDRVLAASR